VASQIPKSGFWSPANPLNLCDFQEIINKEPNVARTTVKSFCTGEFAGRHDLRVKTALIIATLLILTSLSARGDLQGKPQVAGQTSASSDLGSPILQQPCTTADDLLKYQQFLRKESDEEKANLDQLIQRVEILAAIAAAIFVFFGLNTTKGIRSAAKNHLGTIESEANQKIEKIFEDMQHTSRTRFDTRRDV
jgi:hypothetical protein